MSSWKDIFRRRTEDWVYSYLAAEQVPDNIEPRRVEKNSAYLSITLKSARVVNVRRGLSRFYGTVHSYASVPHLSGAAAEFQVVTTPNNLKDVDAAHIDRVTQLDQRLLGPVPYRQELELEIGLFSVRSADLAAPFISLLESLSKVASVAFISAAIPFAEPLKIGINLLLGSNDSSVLEIGMAASSWEPRAGYFVVMRVPRQQVEIERLRVRSDDYRLVDSDNNPVGNYPYMVFKVEASPIRDDWFMIPEVSEAYNQLNSDIRQWRHRDAKESLIVFKRTVLTSGDLLEDHARTLADSVETKYREIAEEGLLSGDQEQRQALPELHELSPF